MASLVVHEFHAFSRKRQDFPQIYIEGWNEMYSAQQDSPLDSWKNFRKSNNQIFNIRSS